MDIGTHLDTYISNSIKNVRKKIINQQLVIKLIYLLEV